MKLTDKRIREIRKKLNKYALKPSPAGNYYIRPSRNSLVCTNKDAYRWACLNGFLVSDDDPNYMAWKKENKIKVLTRKAWFAIRREIKRRKHNGNKRRDDKYQWC